MDTKITIDMLTDQSVSVKTQSQIIAEGQTFLVGDPHRCAYVNSEQGRQQIAVELPEPYLSAVMAVWGDAPTIEPPDSKEGEQNGSNNP